MQLPAFLATARLRWRAVLVSALIGFIIWVLAAGWKALLPFFVGLILTYLMLPGVHLFERLLGRLIRRKRAARTIAIVIMFIIVISFITLLITNFIPIIRNQVGALLRTTPTIYGRVISLLQNDWPDFVSRIPPEFQDIVNKNLQDAINSALTAVQSGLFNTVTLITQTISLVLGMLIIPFWVYIVLQDEDQAWRGFYSMIPASWRDDVRYLIQIMDHVLHAYIRSQLVGMVLIWVMTTVTLLFMHIDLAVLWGTLAGLTEVIPIIGPYIGAIPPIIWTLAYWPQMTIWVIVAYLVIQNVVGLAVMPRISGDATRIHPAFIMIIVLVGAQAAGFWGVLLGVPLAAMVRDVFRYLYLRTTENGTTPQEALASFRAMTAARPMRGVRFLKA